MSIKRLKDKELKHVTAGHRGLTPQQFVAGLKMADDKGEYARSNARSIIGGGPTQQV